MTINAMTINYHFRYQTREVDAPIGLLLRYLRDDDLHPSVFHRDMVLQAVKSFWLPFACQAFGYDSIEYQKHARSAVYQLRQHILYVQSECGLDPELFVQMAPSFPASTVIPVATAAVQEPMPEIAEVVKIEPSPTSALVLPDLDDDPFS